MGATYNKQMANINSMEKNQSKSDYLVLSISDKMY